MSAVIKESPQFRPLRSEDIDVVMAIESIIYPFPWTAGNFRDSLRAGYSCWAYEFNGHLFGYAILMIGAGEAHLLNISIASEWQRQGWGRKLMQHLIQLAREYAAENIFLEVRSSNVGAQRLYEDIGFTRIALRKNYYPNHSGREDAILMGLRL